MNFRDGLPSPFLIFALSPSPGEMGVLSTLSESGACMGSQRFVFVFEERPV
jgi:hypothetical protein